MLVKGIIAEKAAQAAQELEVVKKNFLPLNLQYFSEDPNGGQGGNDDTPPGDDNPPGDDEPPADDKGDNPPADDKKKKSKDFTQDDVSAIAAREARKAEEKLLKKLGVKDFKSAKDGLDAFTKMQNDQKTDAQKLADRATQLEADYNAATGQVKTLSAQLAAFKAGVKADSLDDVIVLADKLVTDDVTIDDAIGQVLKKYPQFKNEVVKETKKPKFTDGDHKTGDDKPSDKDKWSQAFKWGQ